MQPEGAKRERRAKITQGWRDKLIGAHPPSHIFTRKAQLYNDMILIFRENGKKVEHKAQNIFTEAGKVIFLSGGIQFTYPLNDMIGVKWNEE